MLNSFARRLRLFLQSELDLSKDRIVAELRQQRIVNYVPNTAVGSLGWTLRPDGDGTEVVGLGITFNNANERYFIECLEVVALLVRDLSAKVQRLPDGRIEIQVGKVRVTPQNLDELMVFFEVFHDEFYLVETPMPMFVWDIGANVGYAAIYFAQVMGWDVDSYELFPETAALAQKNIDASGLSKSVSVTATGVGGWSRKLTLPYYPATRGENGFYRANGGREDTTNVEVEVSDAAEILERVVSKAAGRPILAKIDCEGAEFEIVERLKQSGQIRSITSMVVEVHEMLGLDPFKMVSMLTEAGFVVRRSRRMQNGCSMFFATQICAVPSPG